MRLIVLCLNLLSVLLLVLIVSLITPFIYSKFFNRPVYIDSAFKPYLKDFESDAKKYDTDISLYKLITIFSTHVPEGIAGYCLPHSKLVVISKRSWDDLKDDGRKSLLYHEWGHCILRREHVEEEYGFPSYCPASIMYPYIEPMRRCYGEYKESYNQELFMNPFNFKKFSRRKK